jgi:hypothetical protein
MIYENFTGFVEIGIPVITKSLGCRDAKEATFD